MNTRQLQGTFGNLAGQIQERVGRLMGSNRQKLKGLQRQVMGRAEQKLGNLQAAAMHTVGHRTGIRF